MENNLKRSKTMEANDKLSLSKKSRLNLVIDFLLVTFFLCFFMMTVFLYKRMESIEQKLYRIKNNHNFFSLIKIDDFDSLKKFKKASYIVLNILAGLDFIILYINIIYLLFHPFIGLKLNFIVNISYFGIIIIRIIMQGNRPFWKYNNYKLIEETDCRTDYASPSAFLFFFSFFYLYSILSFQKLNKQKIKLIYRFLIFFIHIVLILVIALTFLGEILDDFFHQLTFSAVLGYILICILLAKDKNIHNFIFQTMKNKYNARKYKIKMFFYIIGLIVLTLIAAFFIDENDIYSIKYKLKNCKNVKLFGVKESLKDLDNVISIVGAIWGSSFTLDQNIRKWWGKTSITISIIKIIIIIIFNGAFIVLKYFLPKLITDVELNFILDLIINFLENFLTFGIIPLIFNKWGLISKDDQINVLRTTLFKKKSDDEIIILNTENKNEEKDKQEKDTDKDKEKKDKEEKKSDEKENEIKDKSDKDDKDEKSNKKSKEENKEIYGDSNLVENVQNEDEEEEYLYLEGIDENENKK